jgi:raffinose synthase
MQKIKNENYGNGKIISFNCDNKISNIEIKLNLFIGKQILCTYRNNACFMRSLVANSVSGIPDETTYMLTKNNDEYYLYYTLISDNARCVLKGGSSIVAKISTGDINTKIKGMNIVYYISGQNIYDLFSLAADDLCKLFNGLERIKNKKRPKLLGGLGLCTYNAFYNNYSDKKIYELLEIFKKHNQSFSFILLDDGWLTSNDDAQMAAFYPDSKKFPKGLKNFVDTIKSTFNINDVILWHAIYGYWRGVSDNIGNDYNAEKLFFNIETKEDVTETINTMTNEFYPSNLAGKEINFIWQKKYEFFNDFYNYLADCGVNGTKVDATSWLELFGEERGGRVNCIKEYISAINIAKDKYFTGGVISCSSNSNDFIFNSGTASIIRVGEDYLPEIPSTHGKKIIYDAINSMWFGEYFICDCDMFQSGNIGGIFHAINSAISGGLIYCTDNIQTINFDLISALSDKNGFVPVLKTYAKIAEDSFFFDSQESLFKKFNYKDNMYAMALFNCGNCKIEDSFLLSQIDKIEDRDYFVYSYLNKYIGKRTIKERISLSLDVIEADFVSVIPIINDIAVIGAEGKINPYGFVVKEEWINNVLNIKMQEECEILLYIDNKRIDYCSENYFFVDNILRVYGKNISIKLKDKEV